MVHLNDDTFEFKIEESKILLIKISTKYCQPCRTLIPVISDIEDKYSDEVDFASIDLDNCPGVSEKYGITSVPTLFFFKDGKLKDKLVGLQNRLKIESVLNRLIA